MLTYESQRFPFCNCKNAKASSIFRLIIVRNLTVLLHTAELWAYRRSAFFHGTSVSLGPAVTKGYIPTHESIMKGNSHIDILHQGSYVAVLALPLKAAC